MPGPREGDAGSGKLWGRTLRAESARENGTPSQMRYRKMGDGAESGECVGNALDALRMDK